MAQSPGRPFRLGCDELVKLDSRRSIVALVSAAMTVTAFASLLSGLFVVNRRCWVIPCARRTHGTHGELLGLRVRAGDAFSCLSSTACALMYAWGSFRMFAVEGTFVRGRAKFAAYKGVTLGMVLVLLQQAILWMEETGTVGTFVHRGAALLHNLNNNGDGGGGSGTSFRGGIPNVYLLHAMQSLAIFVSLTFLLGSGVAWCVFNWEDDLVASNEYQAIPGHDGDKTVDSEQNISIPVIESPTLQRRLAAKRRKREAKRAKKAKKKSSRSRSSTKDSVEDIDSEEDFGNLEKELELGHGNAELKVEEDVGVVDL